MRHWTLGLIGLWAAGAVAQTAPPAAPPNAPAPPKSDELVVTGRRAPDKAELRRQVDGVAGHPGFDKPLARFIEPVCLGTMGLGADTGAAILDRMVQVAEAARVPMNGKATCSPNVLVLFIDDSHAGVERIAKRTSGLMRSLSYYEVKALLKEPGPVYAWSAVETRSRDGDRMAVDFPGDVPQLKVSTATRTALPIRQDMLSSVVIIERKAVAGKLVTQIADYAAMRAFAETEPRRKGDAATILSLFDEGVVAPVEMTAFDRGYLRGVYSGAPNQLPGFQIGGMARAIGEEMIKEDAGP